jgi:hypothetical protein
LNESLHYPLLPLDKAEAGGLLVYLPEGKRIMYFQGFVHPTQDWCCALSALANGNIRRTYSGKEAQWKAHIR